MITGAYARLRAAIPLLVTVAASMSLGCSGAPAGPERAANVTMRDLAFDPGTIEVRSGERVRLGISRPELARRLGLDPSTVRVWAAKGVGPRDLQAVADVLGVTPDALWRAA